MMGVFKRKDSRFSCGSAIIYNFDLSGIFHMDKTLNGLQVRYSDTITIRTRVYEELLNLVL